MQPYREGTRGHPDAQAHLEPRAQLQTQDQPETRPQRETRGTRGRPGTPSLLRELNDRAALGLLLGGEMLTRSQISEYTGVSKVTVSQMLTRLEERGLVAIAGEQAGGRGPNAALYSVVPSSAYVAGLYVESDLVSAAVADVTGRRVAEVSGNPNGGDDPVELVRGTVERACASAGIEVTRLSALVIGSPGVVDPRTGDPRLAVNLPAWHEGALDALKERLAQAGRDRERREPGRDGRTCRRRGRRRRRFRPGLAGRRSRPGHHLGRTAAPGHGRGGGRDRLPAGTRRPAAHRHPASGQRRLPVPGRRQRGARARGQVRIRGADAG